MPHELQTSTHSRLHACSRAPELQSFIPLRHHICTLCSPSPYLLEATRWRRASRAPPPPPPPPLAPPLQAYQAGAGSRARKSWIAGRSWGASQLHHYHFGPRCAGCSKASASTPPHLHACGASPDLHTSISSHLQHASRPPDLHASTPPRLHVRSAPSELRSSIPLHPHVPPRPQAHSMPPQLQIS